MILWYIDKLRLAIQLILPSFTTWLSGTVYIYIFLSEFLAYEHFSWFDYRRRRASITIGLSHVTWGGWGRWKQVQIWRYEVAISTPEIKRTWGWYQSVSLFYTKYAHLAKIRKKVQFREPALFFSKACLEFFRTERSKGGHYASEVNTFKKSWF